jgi:hypothetical protein
MGLTAPSYGLLLHQLRMLFVAAQGAAANDAASGESPKKTPCPAGDYGGLRGPIALP